MTRKGSVVFEKGEPFAFITLMEHKKLEEITAGTQTPALE
jgi:hypothetical protein